MYSKKELVDLTKNLVNFNHSHWLKYIFFVDFCTFILVLVTILVEITNILVDLSNNLVDMSTNYLVAGQPICLCQMSYWLIQVKQFDWLIELNSWLLFNMPVLINIMKILGYTHTTGDNYFGCTVGLNKYERLTNKNITM